MIIFIGFVFNGYFVYLLCHQWHGFNHRLGYTCSKFINFDRNYNIAIFFINEIFQVFEFLF